MQIPPPDATTARYVYCVTARLEGASFGDTGIDGRPVYPISQGGLSALVHDCPPEPYQGEDESVRRWVAAHTAVVDAAWAAAGSVLPMSFDVIVAPRGNCTAEENLRAWLEQNEERLRAKLEEFRDKVELGVQLLWNTAEVAKQISASSKEIARLQREMEGKPPGVAYFHRQKIATAVRALMESKADRDYRAYYARIRLYAEEVAVNKLTSRGDGQMLLNLSLLVRKEKVSALGQELSAIGRQEGLEVRFTGPWPPYSFAAKIAVMGEQAAGRTA
jgi:AraC-like DNA-binding protein